MIKKLSHKAAFTDLPTSIQDSIVEVITTEQPIHPEPGFVKGYRIATTWIQQATFSEIRAAVDSFGDLTLSQVQMIEDEQIDINPPESLLHSPVSIALCQILGVGEIPTTPESLCMEEGFLAAVDCGADQIDDYVEAEPIEIFVEIDTQASADFMSIPPWHQQNVFRISLCMMEQSCLVKKGFREGLKTAISHLQRLTASDIRSISEYAKQGIFLLWPQSISADKDNHISTAFDLPTKVEKAICEVQGINSLPETTVNQEFMVGLLLTSEMAILSLDNYYFTFQDFNSEHEKGENFNDHS